MAQRKSYRRKNIERVAKLAYSYARYSTTMQKSIEQQERENRDLAEDEEVEIIGYYADRAIGRDIDDRDDLERMFADLRRHPEVGYIVTNELERLTSGVGQRARIAALCRELQVTIITEDIGVIDPGDEEKMHEADQRAVAAQGELLRVRRRVKRHMKNLAQQEEKFIMRPCFGMRNREFDRDGVPLLPDEITPEGLIVRAGPWELHPEEYPWLVKIFELADREWTLRDICRYLVEHNVRTKTGRTNWRSATVRQILANDFYIGVYEYGKTEVKRGEGGHKWTEPRPDVHTHRVTRRSPLGEMIDADLWERVQKRRLERIESGDRRFINPGRRTVPDQVFDDRVFCGRCGYKMYGQFDVQRTDKAPPFRYTCKKGDAVQRVQLDGFGPPCTESHSITDRKLIAELATFGKHTAFVEVDPFRNDFDRVEARREAKAEVAKAKTRFERTKALFKEGLETMADVKAEQAKLEAATQKLEALSSSRKIPPTVPSELVDIAWDEMADVLANQALPVANRQALLSHTRLERLYVLNDVPVVKPQFRSR